MQRRLVGFRRIKRVRDRDTGHVDVVQKDRAEWMTRECAERRILSDELAEAVKAKLNLGSMRFGKNAAELRRDGKDPGRRVDVYPTVLVRPVCGGGGKPMALIRPPLETCAPLPWFPILRPLPADGMMLPPDKEAAWMSPNGSVAIGAGLLA